MNRSFKIIINWISWNGSQDVLNDLFNQTELVLRPAEGGWIWSAIWCFNYLFFWFRSFQLIDSTCSEKHSEQFFQSDWTGLSDSCWIIEHRTLFQTSLIHMVACFHHNIKILCYDWSDHPSIKISALLIFLFCDRNKNHNCERWIRFQKKKTNYWK